MHLRAGTPSDPTSKASYWLPELVYYVDPLYILGAARSEPFKGCFHVHLIERSIFLNFEAWFRGLEAENSLKHIYTISIIEKFRGAKFFWEWPIVCPPKK